MYVFNAENEMSPLIKAGSNIFKVSSDRNVSDGLRNKRKQFPELKYGYNAESQNFLRMPNVYDNAYSKNSMQDKKAHNYSPSNLANRPADQYNVNSHTHSRDKDNNVPKDMEKYMAKLTNRMKNVLVEDTEMHTLSTDSTYNPKKSQTDKRPDINLSQAMNKINTNRQISHKEIYESAPYLNNINEYNIKESYNVNEERIFKYNKKTIEDFNCVIGKKISMSPAKYSVDKWPLFYEKYYTIFIIKLLQFST